MATRNIQVPAAVPTQLCDYCHQKPKFSNHAYCSKTCATQAATLCNHCHKKPKFQNFEYCGKNCASLANASGAGPKPAVGVQRPGAHPAGQGVPGARGNGARHQPQQQLQQSVFDPLQIAKLVVQQMPQVQALLNATNTNSGNAYQAVPNGQGHYAPQVAVALASNNGASGVNPGMNSANNPFLTQVNPAQQQAASGALHFNSAAQPVAEDLECLIPGCGKPVHVDAQGLKSSDYCSQRHREEAVTSGLVAPCIMCLTRPQSHTDYFCGRTCREESLNKHYDAADEEEPDEEERNAVHQGLVLGQGNGNGNVGIVNGIGGGIGGTGGVPVGQLGLTIN